MNVEMTVQVRTGTGKELAGRLRRAEQVPAVLYGPKAQTLSLSVPAAQLEKLLRDMGEESRLLRLTIEGGEEQQVRQVLIREIQVHPIRRRFLHVDFYEVPLDRAIVVEVPVEMQGEAVGIKKGGTLNLIRRTLAVRCLPGEIPERIQVDISGLDLGDTIHVADLLEKVPFELVGDRSFAVVTVASPEGKGAAGEGEGAGA